MTNYFFGGSYDYKSDKHKGPTTTGIDPVEFMIGIKAKSRWAYAYDTMDLWADSLAKFLSESRGQAYQPPHKKKTH